jgi:hypothetical protein
MDRVQTNIKKFPFIGEDASNKGINIFIGG